MEFNVVGKNSPRWDAISKVTGKAEYTDDLPKKKMLYGKICRATIAHGYVKSIDVREALKVPGVIKVLTADDVPDYLFTTAGHPHSILPDAGECLDRSILTKKIRLYGDEIAGVIAESEMAAEIGVSKIKVEYEVLPFYLTPEEAMADGAAEIHTGTGNIIADTKTDIGEVEKAFKEADYIFEDDYRTQIVQHCQMENQTAYAYQAVDNRWVCVSSTQIPHLVRHILGDAFNMPIGSFRVIKPFIGGGFGNKQDVVIEPLTVAMSMAVGGNPVMLTLTREEVFSWTRTRHSFHCKLKMGVTKEGIIKGIETRIISQGGAYASHGHSVTFVGEENIHILYNVENYRAHSTTVYTNTATGGAMRGYGTPQIAFTVGAMTDKIARDLGMDPVEFQLKNVVKEGEVAHYNQIEHFTNGLVECIEKGKEAFNWNERKRTIKERETTRIRRGIGLSTVCYGSNTRPGAPGIEIAGCRLILNQDGSIKLMLGATEIGQGSDTVLAQMAAEIIGVPFKWIIVDKTTDTDIAPFDPGAFASRQTYVTGLAIRKGANELKEKIKEAVKVFHPKIDPHMVDIVEGNIVYKKSGAIIESLGDLALKTYYDIHKGSCLTADVSYLCLTNSYAACATFAEVEVDVGTGKVNIVDIMNVHDAGTIINPLLAEGQVHGGMSMGIAYGLSEELKYDEKTGKPLNNNLLDYKIPTFMDMPDLQCAFVEKDDPISSFGNKALGEPPACGPAPAIRNAVVDAIGVEVNSLPIHPQKVLEALEKG